jgi:signal transduction histidine kinase
MATSSRKGRKASRLAGRYGEALRRYLKQGARTRPASAVKLGREAVALGLDVLDLAMIHEETLIAHVISMTSTARARAIRRAGKFFAEAIVPMEETHRTALENNARLTQLNQALDQRTRDLSASNRKLKSEIAKRKVVEQSLRKSERRSGRLLDQSRRLQEELRHLSRWVLSAQEEERKRISRELHDLVAQTLTVINVHLANLRMEATQNTKGLTKNIARTQKLVEKSVDKVHRFARELRPAILDDLGLIPALHSFMKSFTEETGIRVSLTAFAGVKDLSNAKRTALYRVAQEALTNVARHAHASRASVHIKRLPNAVRMQIKDNGRSFDVERVLSFRKNRRMGLLGMRERVEMVGGKFTVESAPEAGTTVGAQIPFRNGNEERARP